MASITWIDSSGVAVLTNGKQAPANKFNAWTPARRPIGPAATGLGTGTIHRFRFRTDTTASFQIDAIPGTDANMELMLRLQEHLLNGGTVALDPGLAPQGSLFTTSSLAPETEPQIDFSDRQMLEYSFVVTLRGSGGGDTGWIYPAFIPGLKLWLKGDNDTLAATKADEDFVGGWYDDSGEGNDAVQADGTKQPRYYTGVANGHPVISFDGDNDVLETPGIMVPTVAPGTTLFWVLKRTGAVGSDESVFFCFKNGSEANGNMFSTVLEQGVAHPGDMMYQTLTSPGVGAQIIGVGTADDFNIHCLAFASSSSVTNYTNGTTGSTFSIYDVVETTAKNIIRLGRVGSGFEPYAIPFDIAEMIWYEGILSASDRNGITRYLSLKYNIAVTV